MAGVKVLKVLVFGILLVLGSKDVFSDSSVSYSCCCHGPDGVSACQCTIYDLSGSQCGPDSSYIRHCTDCSGPDGRVCEYSPLLGHYHVMMEYYCNNGECVTSAYDAIFCESDQICVDGECVCVPDCNSETECCAGKQCGTVFDGCGKTYDCGTCDLGFTCCDYKCVNLSIDENHCGNCNNACPSDKPVCCDGVCEECCHHHEDADDQCDSNFYCCAGTDDSDFKNTCNECCVKEEGKQCPDQDDFCRNDYKCKDIPDPKEIGFILLNGIKTGSMADYEIQHISDHSYIPVKARAKHYCYILDDFFNQGECNKKGPYSDCDVSGATADIVYFNEINTNEKWYEVGCRKAGLWDRSCNPDWVPFYTTRYFLRFLLCDSNSGIPCEGVLYPEASRTSSSRWSRTERFYGTVNIDLADFRNSDGEHYSYECVQIYDPVNTIGGCTKGDTNTPEYAVPLYAINQLQPCGEEGSGNICVDGVCKNFYCKPDGELHELEQCDPVGDQSFWVKNEEGEKEQVAGEDITCYHFDLYPAEADEENKPFCDEETCRINTSNCIDEGDYAALLCGNHQIDVIPISGRIETCDWYNHSDPHLNLEYEHPYGDIRVKDVLLRKKTYCGAPERICGEEQPAKYIGDAYELECDEECKEVIYDYCDPDLSSTDPSVMNESNCADGLNNNYWYVMENPHDAIGSDGYFDMERVRYNTELCLNSTHCTDCQDRSCDLEEGMDIHGHYGICNFKEELFCNDGFDNDGDGLVDLEDDDCSDIPRYNPEQSATGYCNVHYHCYLDRNSMTERTKELCYGAGEIVWDAHGEFICTDEFFWTSPLKAMAGVFFSLTDQNDYSIYCNDYGNNNEGYVVAYNSKTPTGMSAGDLLRMSGSSFGKFCAFTSGSKWGVSAKIKDVNEENPEDQNRRIQSAMPLFSSNNAACSNAASARESSLISACDGDSMVFLNAKYGTLFRTNSDINSKPALAELEAIRQAISQLDPLGNIVQIPLELRHGATTEAFVWKKKEAKEIIGAIEQLNKTAYAMILYKNIDDFKKLCNELSFIKISTNLAGTCTDIGNGNYLIHWTFPVNSAELQASKAKFNELVRDIKIS